MNNSLRNRQFILPFVIGVLVIGFAFVYASDTEQITVCVRKNGMMRLVDDDFKRNECRKNETLLSWNIKGEKGDKGDMGEQGVPGENGTDGEDGKDGSTLHLFDADGQDLGVLIYTVRTVGTYTVYVPEIDGFLDITQRASESLIEATGVDVNFETPDCTGQPFFSVSPGFPQVIYYNSAADKYYKRNPDDDFASRDSLSRLDFHRGCVGDISTKSHTLHLEEITLPFTEPFALPLEVR